MNIRGPSPPIKYNPQPFPRLLWFGNSCCCGGFAPLFQITFSLCFSPGEALVIFLRLGGVFAEKPCLLLCQSSKALGDTLNNGAPVSTISVYACTLPVVYTVGVCFGFWWRRLTPGQDGKRPEKLHEARCLVKVSHRVGAAYYMSSQKTHYFAIKLSSATICRCMYSVISGDITMSSTFINYPFVTMWISLCLFLYPPSSSPHFA